MMGFATLSYGLGVDVGLINAHAMSDLPRKRTLRRPSRQSQHRDKLDAEPMKL